MKQEVVYLKEFNERQILSSDYISHDDIDFHGGIEITEKISYVQDLIEYPCTDRNDYNYSVEEFIKEQACNSFKDPLETKNEYGDYINLKICNFQLKNGTPSNGFHAHVFFSPQTKPRDFAEYIFDNYDPVAELIIRYDLKSDMYILSIEYLMEVNDDVVHKIIKGIILNIYLYIYRNAMLSAHLKKMKDTGLLEIPESQLSVKDKFNDEAFNISGRRVLTCTYHGTRASLEYDVMKYKELMEESDRYFKYHYDNYDNCYDHNDNYHYDDYYQNAVNDPDNLSFIYSDENGYDPD